MTAAIPLPAQSRLAVDLGRKAGRDVVDAAKRSILLLDDHGQRAIVAITAVTSLCGILAAASRAAGLTDEQVIDLVASLVRSAVTGTDGTAEHCELLNRLAMRVRHG